MSEALDKDGIKEFYNEIEASLLEVENLLVECISRESADSIDDLFRFFHNIKGTAGMFNLFLVQEVFHVSESLLQILREKKTPINSEISTILLECIDQFKNIIQFACKEGKESEDKPYELLGRVVRVKRKYQDEEKSGESDGDLDPDKDESKEKGGEGEKNSKQKSEGVKLTKENSEELIEMVSQYIQIQNQLEIIFDKKPELQPIKNDVNHFSSRLQNFILKIQLTPIHPLLQGLKRVASQAAQATNKKVNLVIIGGETQFDRRSIETLRDPLIHMLRNSIDHGIELPDDRESKDKSPIGTIVFEASQKSGNMNLSISDDGRGIDPEKIKKIAMEKGLITQEVANRMSVKEALNLIFVPGFSTAEKVTSLSGRGVGMDSVKTAIESMGGSIETFSEVGKGTTITLSIPLTLAIVKSIVFYVNKLMYAVPENSVEEILTEDMALGKNNLSLLENGEKALHFKNRVIPVISISNFLFQGDATTGNLMNPPPTNSSSAHFLSLSHSDLSNHKNYIVVKIKDRIFALETDRIVGPKDFVAQPLPDVFAGVQAIGGVNQINSGEYIGLLDLGVLSDNIQVINNQKIKGASGAQEKVGDHNLSDVFRSEMKLIFFRSGQNFAIPVQSVDRVLEVTRDMVEYINEKCFLTIKDVTYPAIQMSVLFCQRPLVEKEKYMALIVHREGKLAAILCEEFDGVHRLPGQFEVFLKTKGTQGAVNLNQKSYNVANIHTIFAMEFPEEYERKQFENEFGKFNVLVVEDDPFFSTLLRDALVSKGVTVTVAKDGQEGKEILTATLDPENKVRNFDYVITDFEMPRMTGIQLLEWIRGHKDLKSLPVSMCTAVGDDTTRKVVQRLGVDNYTGKMKYDQVFDSIKKRVKDKELGVIRDIHSQEEEAQDNLIQRILVFEINQKFYGIEISVLKDISQCSVPTHIPGMMNCLSRIVGFRGYPIPVLDLRALVKKNVGEKASQIVLSLESGYCALWVDNVITVSCLADLERSRGIQTGPLGQDVLIGGLLKDVLWDQGRAIGLLDIKKIDQFMGLIKKRYLDKANQKKMRTPSGTLESI